MRIDTDVFLLKDICFLENNVFDINNVNISDNKVLVLQVSLYVSFYIIVV